MKSFSPLTVRLHRLMLFLFVGVFACIELRVLVGEDKSFASAVKEWHELAGRIGCGLIGVHAAAALPHHFVQHDDTLRRMLPRLGKVAP